MDKIELREQVARKMGRKGDRRRANIIDQGYQLAMKGGLEMLTIREVATQLGITHGNVQYYFPKRSDLLLALFDHALQQYSEAINSAIISATTPEEHIKAIVYSGLETILLPETTIWRMAIAVAEHDPDIGIVLKKQNTAYRDFVAAQILSVWPQTSEELRTAAARAINAILDGMAVQAGSEKLSREELLALEPYLTNAVVGILKAGSAKS